jgi:hypothetical protein
MTAIRAVQMQPPGLATGRRWLNAPVIACRQLIRNAVEADDGGVTEVCIDAVKAGRVETSSSSIIHLSPYHLAFVLIGPGIG